MCMYIYIWLVVSRLNLKPNPTGPTMWYIDRTHWIHDNLKVNWLVGKNFLQLNLKESYPILNSYKIGEGVYNSTNSTGRGKNSQQTTKQKKNECIVTLTHTIKSMISIKNNTTNYIYRKQLNMRLYIYIKANSKFPYIVKDKLYELMTTVK